jgi:hypothetical protein
MPVRKAVLVLIAMYFLQLPAYAADKISLTLQVADGASYTDITYHVPYGNIINVSKGQNILSLKVVLKNISSYTQSLSIGPEWGGSEYKDESGVGLITFEVTDENGNNNVITKTADLNATGTTSYIYLGSGQTKEIEILMTSNDWDNAFKLSDKGATKLRARASYKNGSDIIYSDYYTINLKD